MYRIKQFIWAILCTFKAVDYKFIDEYLDKDERIIFDKLKKSEKHHSLRVCYDALDMAKQTNDNSINYKKLGRMALLHDVGKSEFGLNVIDKSIIVILDKITKGKLKAYDKYKRIDSYYNHPIKSIKLLKEIKDYDSEFLDGIVNHHKKIGAQDSIYLKLLKKSDDLN